MLLGAHGAALPSSTVVSSSQQGIDDIKGSSVHIGAMFREIKEKTQSGFASAGM